MILVTGLELLGKIAVDADTVLLCRPKTEGRSELVFKNAVALGIRETPEMVARLINRAANTHETFDFRIVGCDHGPDLPSFSPTRAWWDMLHAHMTLHHVPQDN